jgi:hypothetical protein
MKAHQVIWTPPSPLWPGAAVSAVAHPENVPHAPSIFRFATDNFMDDFMNTLATDPVRLDDYRARPETWRGFAASPVAELPAPPTSSPFHPLRLLLQRRAQVIAQRPASPVAPGGPLKLYQPAHQRHYLVASSLVCDVLGLPDRRFEAGKSERASFVIRRLLPPPGDPPPDVRDWPEHAWVRNANGFAWQQIADADRTISAETEEHLPLFAVPLKDQALNPRRVFAGIIPVGKREAYLGAPTASGDTLPGVTSRTARKILFRKEVLEPWKSLVTRAAGVQQRWTKAADAPKEDRDATLPEKSAQLKSEREQIQVVSWLVLLDFAKFLALYLTPVWRAVLDPAQRGALEGYQQTLFDVLDSTGVATALYNVLHKAGANGTGDDLYPQSSIVPTLREALARFGSGADSLNTALEQQLEQLDTPYDRADPDSRAAWPDFLFPLADPEQPDAAPLPSSQFLAPFNAEEQDLTMDEKPDTSAKSSLDLALDQLDQLAVVVVRALRDNSPPVPEPAVPAAAIAPANLLEGWFIIRCVYERPQCLPLHHESVSDPTEPFQLAGFFDPDAPARPIRIGLPLDTSPAGLRKFDKNTAFVISDILCGQIRRIRGITLGDLIRSVLPWPLHKDLSVPDGGSCKGSGGASLGMICSLSIPIVTICALILVIIMVSLLDFIFRWMPFFVFCFPLPGLKAKKT